MGGDGSVPSGMGAARKRGGGDGRGRGWPVEDLVSHSKALILKAPQKFHMCSAPFVCELLATTWDFSINLQYTLYGSASIYIKINWLLIQPKKVSALVYQVSVQAWHSISWLQHVATIAGGEADCR